MVYFYMLTAIPSIHIRWHSYFYRSFFVTSFLIGCSFSNFNLYMYIFKKSHGSYKSLKYTRCRKLVQKIFSHWHIQKQIILHVLLSCTLVGYIPFLQFFNINPFLQFVMIPVLFLLLFSNGLLFTKAD